jgi:hypothetical protein
MKTRQSGLALFANALASTFTLFPRTNYQTAFPHKSAAKRMDEAWAKTGSNMHLAMSDFDRKHGIAR